MKIEIFIGAKRSNSVCCGAEVATILIDSCCGTQDLPDELKISFLRSCIAESDFSDKVQLIVSNVGEAENFNAFKQYSESLGNDNTKGDELLPLCLIDNIVKFVGQIPTCDELLEELEQLLA